MKWFFFSVLGVFGLAVFVTGVIWGLNRYLAIHKGTRTRGTIVAERKDVSEYTNNSGKHYNVFYYPVVEFKTGGGETIRFEGTTGVGEPTFITGTPVNVVYDPRNPHDARVNDFSNLWFGPVTIATIGLAVLIIAVIVFFVMNQDEVFDKRASRMLTDVLITDSRSIKLQGIVREVRRSFGSGAEEYIVVCQARTRDGETELYDSTPLAFDPGADIIGRAVDVHLDPQAKTRYAVNIQPVLQEIINKQR